MILTALGTYLPPWSGRGGRIAGPDEDAVTMAVEAGRSAMTDVDEPITQVVLVTRDPTLLKGGNGPVLLAGLGLDAQTDVVERLGGAPATLDAVACARPGTLIMAADAGDPAGAGAAFVGTHGGEIAPAGRVQRSLPVDKEDDPRLLRERGVRASLDAAGLPGKPLVLAGVDRRDAGSFCEGDPPSLPTEGASSAMFALAALADRGTAGLVAAAEQASLAAAELDPAGVKVHRCEPEAQQPPSRRVTPGPEIKVVVTAYDRAFEPKVRWQAGRCTRCGALAFPPRYRCLECGSEAPSDLVPLPRSATVYSCTTISVPVPSMATPYSLAVVEVDDVGVRALVTVTDVPPGSVDIGDRGGVVLRRIAVRAGVPDYGYSFSPLRAT